MTEAAGISAVIAPRIRDLGNGFSVMRVLPHAERRNVGPFVFLDQMGPVVLHPGQGLDVRPHPHIGLATVTYLFHGTITHRDSLGSVRDIEPGAVNWMTAGRGIVHSERSPAKERGETRRLSGIQSWVALPREKEETEPDFVHHPATSLPDAAVGGASWRVIAGRFRGLHSPVKTFTDTLYVDVLLEVDARFHVPPEHEERGAYLAEGTVRVAGKDYESGRLLVFTADREVTLEARTPARLILLGGAPLDGPRHVWWNFVSSSEARIEAAKTAWRAGAFDPVPGETEFIPLPD